MGGVIYCPCFGAEEGECVLLINERGFVRCLTHDVVPVRGEPVVVSKEKIERQSD